MFQDWFRFWPINSQKQTWSNSMDGLIYFSWSNFFFHEIKIYSDERKKVDWKVELNAFVINGDMVKYGKIVCNYGRLSESIFSMNRWSFNHLRWDYSFIWSFSIKLREEYKDLLFTLKRLSWTTNFHVFSRANKPSLLVILHGCSSMEMSLHWKCISNIYMINPDQMYH